MRNQASEKGFTLIELIIVVVIIGILSTLVMSNFVGIRGRIRDGQRKSDVNQVKAAVEIYRSDYGMYPTTDELNLTTSECGQPFSSNDGNVYLQKKPCDPMNDQEFVYTYTSDGATFSLITCLENINEARKNEPTNSPPCAEPDSWSYTVTNP